MKKNIEVIKIWQYILVSFSLVVLSSALKHYLVCAIYTSAFCSYLCPSVLGRNVIAIPVFLDEIFTLQSWFVLSGENFIGITEGYKNLVFSSLVLAPLAEEVMYRGPLYLLKNRIGLHIWWFLALFMTILFVVSHRILGLPLFPIFILGIASSWLIMETKRFWPCIALHFLYNFQTVAFYFYQSTMFGE
jgi:membrane protease YdiL (CAAX protease family)